MEPMGSLHMYGAESWTSNVRKTMGPCTLNRSRTTNTQLVYALQKDYPAQPGAKLLQG